MILAIRSSECQSVGSSSGTATRCRMATTTSYFLERREAFEVAAADEAQVICDAGVAREQRSGAQVSHEWMRIGGDQRFFQELPRSAMESARECLSSPGIPREWVEALRQWASHLEQSSLARGIASVDVRVHGVRQKIVWTDGDRSVDDTRQHVLLDLRVRVGEGRSRFDLWRGFGREGSLEVASHFATAEQTLASMIELAERCAPPIECPSGLFPVIIAGGAASAFFHEVCGHPLEGDVVANDASYLARRMGQRIASEELNVADDPTHGGDAVAFRVDDEGSVPAKTYLIQRGVVAEPLLDLNHARALHLLPNGHGRRTSFRFPALPRMSHLVVEAGSANPDEIIQEVEHGLYLQHIVPKRFDLLTGYFEFHIAEGREIRGGTLGRFVGPGVLCGEALAALTGLDRLGTDPSNHFSVRPCLKLNHGPLAVSFGQPTLRFRELRVRSTA